MNDWWSTDPRQKFWVEITDRPDLGRNIIAPKRAQQGKITPGYELLNYVKEGDLVFHWWRKPKNREERGFYGFSEVTGQMRDGSIPWKSRGRYATNEEFTQKPAKFWNLVNFTEFSRPVLIQDLDSKKDEIFELIENLELKYGKPIYFPFCNREGRVAANQTYFAKIPAELLRILNLNFLDKPDKLLLDATIKVPRVQTSASFARQMDPEKRSSVEKYAERKVREHLESIGYVVENFGKPFDFLATKEEEVVKVEVKGKQDFATSVEVTVNEVEVARNIDQSYRTLLAVVDGINLEKFGENKWVASGGRMRTWWDMPFAEASLFPTRFQYVLPID